MTLDVKGTNEVVPNKVKQRIINSALFQCENRWFRMNVIIFSLLLF